MALFNIYLKNPDDNTILLMEDLLKFATVLIVCDIIVTLYFQGKIPNMQEVLSIDFIIILISVLLGFMAYYMVVKKIINIYPLEVTMQ